MLFLMERKVLTLFTFFVKLLMSLQFLVIEFRPLIVRADLLKFNTNSKVKYIHVFLQTEYCSKNESIPS